MDRRTFFGSVLGTFVGTQIPFKVEEAVPVLTTNLNKLLKITEAFTCAEHAILRKFKIAAVSKEGLKFWAPKFDQIIRDNNKVSLRFICYPIEMHQTIIITGMELCTSENLLIVSKKFAADIPMCSGDVLKITYDLNIPIGEL